MASTRRTTSTRASETAPGRTPTSASTRSRSSARRTERMVRALIAVAALLAGCRGGRQHEAAGTSPLPKLPPSPDGAEELRELDHTIERYRAAHDVKLAEALLARAAI